jgi:hypothetical protein
MPDQTFTAGQVLTAQQQTDLQTNIGLTFIKSQTIGTTVSSVTVTDVFSPSFDNYRIIIAGTVGSTAQDVNFQLSGILGSVYISQGFLQNSGSATVTGYTTNTTSCPIGSITTTNNSQIIIEISGPNLAVAKYMQISTNSALLRVNAAAQIASTTQSTGIIVTPATGTITGGTIRVYGYRN